MTQNQESTWAVLASSALSTIVSRAVTCKACMSSEGHHILAVSATVLLLITCKVVAPDPADTLKARLQVQSALQSEALVTNLAKSFAQVWRAEGVHGFYRGFGPTLAGVVPASAVYFWSYETAKTSTLLKKLGPAHDFAVGCAAQLFAGLVFTPVDIIKERLQVSSLMKAQQNKFGAILASLLARDGAWGLLRGYWHGLLNADVHSRITNSVWIPWTSIYVASYEKAKEHMSSALEVQSSQELPAWAFASTSGGAAAFAAGLTHPIDVVKTRFQVLTATESELTASEVVRRLWRTEGMAGFTSGFLARMLQIAPGAAISWLVYEQSKQYLRAGTQNSF